MAVMIAAQAALAWLSLVMAGRWLYGPSRRAGRPAGRQAGRAHSHAELLGQSIGLGRGNNLALSRQGGPVAGLRGQLGQGVDLNSSRRRRGSGEHFL